MPPNRETSATPSALSGSAADQYRVPVRGRRRELEVIEKGFDAAFSGRRAVTVLSGEPGLGKTRLLDHALHLATGRGWSTVVMAPDLDSTLVPLGALMDAAVRARPPLLRRAELAPVMSTDAPQYWLTRLVADGLENAARATGVLVVVDDLQWLDAGSLGALTALLREFDGIPVHWLLATRTGTHSAAHQRFLAQIVELSTFLELAPLETDDVAVLTRDVLGNVPGPGVETAVARAGGSPLLVLELLHGLEEEGLLRTARGMTDLVSDSLPARFGASARERLRLISSQARRIVQIGSLYGREFPLTLVLDIMGSTAVDAASAVQELLDLGFLVDTGTTLAFRHDTVQSAASDSLTPSLRRAMAGEVLHRRLHAGESVAGLATTIASVAAAGDDASIELLLTAAQTLSTTDMTGAADLVVRAAQLAGGRAIHAVGIANLLPVVLAGGRPDDAREISRTLLPSLDADARGRVGVALARQLTESDFDGAIRETTRALEIPGISEQTQVQLLAVRALNFANKADPVGLRTSLERARAVADPVRDALAMATIDATESVLLFNENRFDDAADLQRQALRRAAEVGVLPGLWLPEGLWTAFMRNSLGFSDDALRMVDEGLAEARAARNITAEAYWMMVRTRVLYDLSRFEEAREQAETVLDLADQLGLGDFAHATAGIALHRIAVHTGDVELFRQSRPLVERLAHGTGLNRAGRWLLVLESLNDEHHEITDPRASFETNFARARERASFAVASLRDPVPSMTTPADFIDDVTLALVCALAGDRATVELIAEIAGDRALANPGIGLVDAMAAATRGIRDRNPDDLFLAVEHLKTVPQPMNTARVTEVAGMLSEGEVAIRTLTTALESYEDLGAARDATRVLHRLRSLGVRRRPRPTVEATVGLSQREHDVAERIAAGMTTRQIADDLMMSPHTVTTHVRHIFAKWDVNSRREVAQRFAGRTG